MLRIKCYENDKGLGRFHLQGSPDQLHASQQLFNLLINSQGKPHNTQLLEALHDLFVTLLKPTSLSESIVACPTDQMLFVADMAGKAQSAYTCGVVLSKVASS